jgi:hypothetical protein
MDAKFFSRGRRLVRIFFVHHNFIPILFYPPQPDYKNHLGTSDNLIEASPGDGRGDLRPVSKRTVTDNKTAKMVDHFG